MNCLDNLIAIRHTCNYQAPSSGLHVNDLAGITLKLADSVHSEEVLSGVKLIEEKRTFAQNAILAQLRNQLADKIKIASVIQNDTVGFYKRDLKAVAAAAGKLKGIKVVIRPNQYFDFFINQISLLRTTSGTENVYVYNLMTGKLLDTFEVTTVADVPTVVTVQKSYLTGNQRTSLFVCSDAEATYETTVSKSTGCYSCASEYSNRYISFVGGQIDSSTQKIDGNVRSNSGTHGISIDYSLNCSVEPFICNMAGQLAWPLLHLTGVNILDELKYSRRLNSIVLLERDNMDELRAKYENEYMSSMQGILNNVRVPNDICFGCNSRIRKTVSIP